MHLKKTLLATVKSVAFVAVASFPVVSITSVVSSSAYAAEKSQISAKVGKPLQAAKDLLAQKKYKEALEKVNEAAAVSGKTAQEDQIVTQFKMAIMLQMGDEAGAAKIIEGILASNQASAGQVPDMLKQLQSIYQRQKDYAKAIQYGERYLKEVGANSEVSGLLLRAYYLKGDYKTAADGARKAIKQSESANKKPDEDVLKFLSSSEYKLDSNGAGYISSLETLLEYYPAPEHWKNIFIVLKNEANYSDRENIEIYRLKKALGLLDGDGYMGMAELSLAMTSPGDAKSAIETGLASGAIKEGERVTRLLNKAKADAAGDLASLDAVSKEAQSKPTGEPLAKIGAAYLGHGQNDKAVSTIQAAITKGGLKSVDESYVRLGVAYYNLGKKAEALKAFQSVSSKSNLARLSRLWIIYIEGKK